MYVQRLLSPQFGQNWLVFVLIFNKKHMTFRHILTPL